MACLLMPLRLTIDTDDNVDQRSVVVGSPPIPAVAADAVNVPMTPEVQAVSTAAGPMTVVNPSLNEADIGSVRRFLLSVGVESRLIENASYAELRGYLRGRMNL